MGEFEISKTWPVHRGLAGRLEPRVPHMTSADTSTIARRALPWLLLLYCGASALHFGHNTEYLAAYPNLPRLDIPCVHLLAWGTIFAIGLVATF